MKITAVILTRNEEKNLKRTIDSVLFCDEIVVIDDYSTDNTNVIAKKLGAKVYQRKLQGDFASQRNFGMTKAQGDWILFVDADEVISKELAGEIKSEIRNPKSEIQAYYIKRRDFFWGQELIYGEISKARNIGLIRLIKKGSKKWFGTVHEVFITAGKTQRLQFFLNHYPHPTLAEFLHSINIYSSLRAKELLWQGKNPNIIETILFPIGKFIYNYFIKLGFLDGPAGFTYAFMMSFHSFLVRAKLYQYTKIDSTQ